MDEIQRLERERRIEIAAKTPEQIVETPEEIAARDRMMALHVNSGPLVDKYEAGWKAAKAYYGIQDLPQVTPE